MINKMFNSYLPSKMKLQEKLRGGKCLYLYPIAYAKR